MEITEKEYERLYNLAYYDNLTGCYNRNWLFENYTDEDEFLLAFVDVNNLKGINDKQGHTLGDELLKQVANDLKGYGNVIRFGGDEFIVIMNNDEPLSYNELYSVGYSNKTKSISIKRSLELADKLMYDQKRLNKKS